MCKRLGIKFFIFEIYFWNLFLKFIFEIYFLNLFFKIIFKIYFLKIYFWKFILKFFRENAERSGATSEC
jgi:hypothetical protein